MDRGAWQAIVHVVAKSQTGLRDFTFTFTSQTVGQQDLIHLTTPDGLDNVGQEQLQHPASGSVNMRIYFKKKKQFIISLHILNLCFPWPIDPTDMYVRLSRAAR